MAEQKYSLVELLNLPLGLLPTFELRALSLPSTFEIGFPETVGANLVLLKGAFVFETQSCKESEGH